MIFNEVENKTLISRFWLICFIGEIAITFSSWRYMTLEMIEASSNNDRVPRVLSEVISTMLFCIRVIYSKDLACVWLVKVREE